MCGIVGIIGRPDAVKLVRERLERLEYRGYDSAGIAWWQGKLEVAKAVGPVRNLPPLDFEASSAIGHTRWATHGGVETRNSHPHLDEANQVAVVHNGTLTNFLALRAGLEEVGVTLRSETDSEVLAHIWSRSQGDAWKRLHAVQSVLAGTYSVAFLEESRISFAKFRNPLWISFERGVGYLASDPIALKGLVTLASPLEDGDHGIMTPVGIELRDSRGNEIKRRGVNLDSLIEATPLGGFEHYMRKEIHESPATLNRVIQSYMLPSGPQVLGEGIERAILLGAGTSFYAASLGALFFRRIGRIRADARTTPEWKDEAEIPENDAVVIACSQSGETLDTVQALVKMQSHPHHSYAVTNHANSSIARMCSAVLPLKSGVEVSVASTKTYLAQCLILYLAALETGAKRGVLLDVDLRARSRALVQLPRLLQRVLYQEDEFREAGAHLAKFQNTFVLGKGLLLPVCMEAALKLKEIAYIHAEAYPAGELKHGPFALLTDKTMVIFLIGKEHQDQVLNSLHEVNSRGAKIIAICSGDVHLPSNIVSIKLPSCPRDQDPFQLATASHLLAYWAARSLGLEIDRPRNLAKSVTVE